MLTKRTWFVIIILGFLGSLAWAVENQFFNTFLYNVITPEPLAISWMVAASAVTATLASILIGSLSDRKKAAWGRKPFILIGYICWGIATIAFPTAAFLKPISLAVVVAIVYDCVMTFFGSSANDSVFHAYVTDITTETNRGRVMGVLQMLTWVSMLIVYGGAGLFIDKFGYFAFFYAIGGLVLILGAIAGSMLQDRRTLEEKTIQVPFLRQITSTFSEKSLRENREFFLVLLSITLWGIAEQVFFPYLMIYLNHFLKLTITQSSILVFIAILVGGIATAYPFGLLADRWGRKPVAILAIVLEAVGLIFFSISHNVVWLTLAGILWLAPISGWTIATSSWVKDLFPEDKRGQFAGLVILFSVALTMIPGPMIGGWLSTTYGIPTVLDGKPGYIPTSIIFQVGGIMTLLAAIPLYFIKRRK
jgi:MFS family permease